MQTTEEKRRDDAAVTFYEWLSKTYGPSAYVILVNVDQLKMTFIAGYMAGREDGKIGV